MNYGDDHYNPRHRYPQSQQQPARMIDVRLVRPSTGSALSLQVPYGTPPEDILHANPGWEFETT